MSEKVILDACCGSRMFWFNKENPNTIFMDIREETFIACDGRSIKIKPDMIADFRNLPFPNKSFKLVVFDPPHDMYAGKKGYTSQKYGNLNKDTWQSDLKLGFDECMRVLEENGVLIFKWNELRVTVTDLIRLFEEEPLFGHKSGKASKTHWLLYMKLSRKEAFNV